MADGKGNGGGEAAEGDALPAADGRGVEQGGGLAAGAGCDACGEERAEQRGLSVGDRFSAEEKSGQLCGRDDSRKVSKGEVMDRGLRGWLCDGCASGEFSAESIRDL